MLLSLVVLAAAAVRTRWWWRRRRVAGGGTVDGGGASGAVMTWWWWRVRGRRATAAGRGAAVLDLAFFFSKLFALTAHMCCGAGLWLSANSCLLVNLCRVFLLGKGENSGQHHLQLFQVCQHLQMALWNLCSRALPRNCDQLADGARPATRRGE